MGNLIDHNEVAHLAQSAIEQGQYGAADAFLNKMLYECTPEVGKEILSERNMALKILTEILLCEERRNAAGGLHFDTWKAAGGYDGFFACYQRIKRAVRRVWFGLSREDIENGFSALSDIEMSPDMFCVIAKYSVPPELWGDAFERLSQVSSLHEDIRVGVLGYLQAIKENGLWGEEKCVKPRKKYDAFSYRKLMYKKGCDSSGRFGECGFDTADINKVAVIYCTNDEGYAAECRKYLEYLSLPKGVSGEILEIWDAPSMAAGYNFAMSQTDAKYKIYIHHDTMVIDSDVVGKLLEIYGVDDAVGMTGVFGSVNLPKSCRWAESSYEDSVLTLWQDAMLDFIRPKASGVTHKEGAWGESGFSAIEAEAIDGAFISTSVDIPWREDVFDNWHYYDISQCFEMRETGYKTALIADDTPWILHESTLRKDPKDLYGKYCGIFKEAYKKHGGECKNQK